MRTIILFDETFDDLVFENRNKSYGAYYLRRVQDVFMARGLALSMALLSIFIFGPKLLASWNGDEIIIEDVFCEVVNLSDVPKIIPTLPPKPISPKGVPPVKSSIKFIDYKVVVDNQVKIEEIPPTNAQIGENVISNATTKGDDSGLNIVKVVEPTSSTHIPSELPVEVKEKTPIKIFEYTTVKPTFPDGLNALMKYLSNNINYPNLARESNIQGKVVVQFVVSPDGSVDMVKVLRGIGGGCDEEAVRVVKQMPKWLPGLNNGVPVNVRFTLPINFSLQ
jgi:periplasmic protein TonB